jgi:ATP-dependent Zn protease
MPYIPQITTMSYIINYGIDNCSTSLYTENHTNITNITNITNLNINICYNFSDYDNYTTMFIEYNNNNINNNNNKNNTNIDTSDKVIYTFTTFIIILLLLLVLYFVIRIYMDKPNANYKELDLIISTKNTKRREDNIIPDGNSIEYNTFDNL